MKPDDPRAQLRQRGLAPKKSFGQNFLVEERVARAIAEACVTGDEIGRATVVELGAGTGALTRLLIERAAHVTAIERDRDLVPVLHETFAGPIADGKLEVIEGDAATVPIAPLLGDAPPRVLCGNLPYQITGKLIQRAVEHARLVDRAVFMVQLEVAERLAAAPGGKEYGALTVFTRAAFDVKKVMNVSRGCFHPPPDVTSAVVMLTARRPPRAEETRVFRDVVKRAFEARRKTLRNAWSGLAPADVIARCAEESGVSLDARGETLAVEAFARMADALARAQILPSIDTLGTLKSGRKDSPH